MRIHIIGVSTTFMSGLALLARQAGNDVTGSDSCITPDIRRKLQETGIKLKEPFNIKNLDDNPDLVVVGNELFPGNVELLEARHRALPYISGALWLEEYVLHNKWSEIGNNDMEKHAPKKDFSPKPAKHAPKLPEHDTKNKQRILR